MSPQSLPECWGHRGASAAFPENTMASFEAAIRDGADCIESDVHVSTDDVVIMFHDPSLDRTTNGTGLIREKHWYGEDGMEHLLTTKLPKQSIPTFEQAVNLLMKPENQEVKFNIDVKVTNDPTRLFSLMHATISAQPNWQTVLAPRLILGLWHTVFLQPAESILPYCRRSHIGVNISDARTYFWDHCEAFSLRFSCLTSADGERFRNECRQAGKKIMVWTVNEPEHMMEAVRWGVDAILTDRPRTWIDLRAALQVDYDAVAAKYGRTFLWTTSEYYFPMQMLWRRTVHARLQMAAGPFVRLEAPATVKA